MSEDRQARLRPHRLVRGEEMIRIHGNCECRDRGLRIDCPAHRVEPDRRRPGGS